MKGIQLYGKTQRFKEAEITVIVTEKLDGSNLTLFKKDGQLYIAQRRNVFTMDQLDEIGYKGLKEWIIEHGADLEAEMHEDSAIIGEWLGMSPYRNQYDSPFQMFAKANITKEYQLINIKYDADKFIYPFQQKIVPDYIGQVPIIGTFNHFLKTEDLDDLYADYIETVDRPVEGFIINILGNIRKYVRAKRGRIEPHVESYEQYQKTTQ